MEEKSIFEMILNKEIDSEIIYEDDEIFAIHDINPVAPIHVLIIPKKKIKTINDVTQEDVDEYEKLFAWHLCLYSIINDILIHQF